MLSVCVPRDRCHACRPGARCRCCAPSTPSSASPPSPPRSPSCACSGRAPVAATPPRWCGPPATFTAPCKAPADQPASAGAVCRASGAAALQPVGTWQPQRSGGATIGWRTLAIAWQSPSMNYGVNARVGAGGRAVHAADALLLPVPLLHRRRRRAVRAAVPRGAPPLRAAGLAPRLWPLF